MDRISEEKRALRQAVWQKAGDIPEAARRASDMALFEAFLTAGTLQKAKSVLIFYGIGSEPDTGCLIAQLRDMGKTVCLPRCLPGRKMEAREVWVGAPMLTSKYGIPEPTDAGALIERDELDLILVPAVCYDRQGYRLGQGGGYYDRYLAGYRGQTVGLCRRALLQERLPREAHDLPVSLVLTEEGALVLK